MNEELTAEFEYDDFDGWFLCGASREDTVLSNDREQLFENCLYLVRAENRRLLQSHAELRNLIDDWATTWNKRILEEK